MARYVLEAEVMAKQRVCVTNRAKLWWLEDWIRSSPRLWVLLGVPGLQTIKWSKEGPLLLMLILHGISIVMQQSNPYFEESLVKLWKYAYFVSCQQEDEKINTRLVVFCFFVVTLVGCAAGQASYFVHRHSCIDLLIKRSARKHIRQNLCNRITEILWPFALRVEFKWKVSFKSS